MCYLSSLRCHLDRCQSQILLHFHNNHLLKTFWWVFSKNFRNSTNLFSSSKQIPIKLNSLRAAISLKTERTQEDHPQCLMCHSTSRSYPKHQFRMATLDKECRLLIPIWWLANMWQHKPSSPKTTRLMEVFKCSSNILSSRTSPHFNQSEMLSFLTLKRLETILACRTISSHSIEWLISGFDYSN